MRSTETHYLDKYAPRPNRHDAPRRVQPIAEAVPVVVVDESDAVARRETSERAEVLSAWFATFAWRGTFADRVERLTDLLGSTPGKLWDESYPSGGGSGYARWVYPTDRGYAVTVRIETGGYDPITGAGFSRAPHVFVGRP